ncbi:ring finger protein 220 [Carabus blaptoides fortunei]
MMNQLSESFEDSGRGCRNKKKQADPTCCPVCSVTLRVSELNSHLGMEMDRLSKISVNKHRRSPRRQSPLSGPSVSTESDETTCPVCNKVTSEDITLHVEMCLQRMDTNESVSEDENIDVEGDDGKFEEYEWAGQMRIRASSLLEGGFAGLGMGSSISKSSAEDEDADVIVDGDDTQIYGSLQYTNEDLVNVTAVEREINSEMPGTNSNTSTTDQNTNIPNADDNNMQENVSQKVVIESLKLKIRELESRDQNKELYKCLICMGRYKTPVVSICCWHVHCEQCWLQTLAAKKLCPQCNMITSPKELRRIYI